MRRTLLSLVLASLLLTVPQGAFAAFSDVPASASYKRAVDVLQQLGAVSGFGDNTFRPNNAVTRAEYLKMLYVGLNRSPERHLLDGEGDVLPFTDVPAGSWMEPYIRSAYMRGIVRGTSETTFSPNRTVTLSEATRMLIGVEFYAMNLLGSMTPEGDEAKALENLKAWLVSRKLVDGTPELTKPLLRKDTVQLLYRWIAVKKTGATAYSTELDTKLQVLPIAIGADGAEELRAFKETLDVLEANYLWREELQDPGAIESAAKGVISELGDPHSEFYTAEETEQFLSSVTGADVGIGVFLYPEPDALVVLRVLPNSPAAKAGIVAGDRIMGIDMYTVGDDPLAAFNHLLTLTTPGQEVVLDVQRASGGREQLRVTLAVIIQPTVELAMKSGGIMAVKIWQFTPNTDEEFLELVSGVGAANIKGILLDLRGNPGGLLESAVEVANVFLPAGAASVIVENPLTESVVTTARTGILHGTPIVVLVDGGSASAAEVLAATIAANDRGTLVGETTYGKGTVQALVPIGTGATLRLTIARWRTPTGKSIDGVGIRPSEYVETTIDDYLAGNDVQLKRAEQLIGQLVGQ